MAKLKRYSEFAIIFLSISMLLSTFIFGTLYSESAEDIFNSNLYKMLFFSSGATCILWLLGFVFTIISFIKKESSRIVIAVICGYILAYTIFCLAMYYGIYYDNIII